MKLANTYNKNNYIVYFIILCLSALVFLPVCFSERNRVGDGSEYYAMFLAWSECHRPWMTESSFKAYDDLCKENRISGLITVDDLRNAFPSLRVAGTADFNHFWFYSLLAYFASLILKIVTASCGVHSAFLFLHYILLTSVFLYAFYSFKWRGVVVVAILTFSSPILWYLDKVHTELFTYCTVLLSVMFVYNKKYLSGALFLSLASTQNPSFALIAFIPFVYRIIFLHKVKFSSIEVCLAILTSILVCAHPIYYFLRVEVPTPTLLAGGSDVGGNLSYFYVWIVDPDIGLLANWPVGILLLLFIGGFFVLKHKKHDTPKDVFLFVFILAYLIINLYAQSSTTNINSGATTGVARYAIWYIPLFFVPAHLILLNFNKNDKALYVFILVCAPLCFINLKNNNPRMWESYCTPTFLSNLIQTKFSFLYNPPPEIFAERFSGRGESVWSANPIAILGPDSRKVLIYSNVQEMASIVLGNTQDIDQAELKSIIFDSLPRNTSLMPYYHMLDVDTEKKLVDASRAAKKFIPGKWLKHDCRNLAFSGWSIAELQHRWSLGKLSEIDFNIDSSLEFKGELLLDGGTHGHQYIEILLNGESIYSGFMDGSTKITAIQFDSRLIKSGNNKLKFLLPDACLASETDHRVIGISLRNLMLK